MYTQFRSHDYSSNIHHGGFNGILNIYQSRIQCEPHHNVAVLQALEAGPPVHETRLSTLREALYGANLVPSIERSNRSPPRSILIYICDGRLNLQLNYTTNVRIPFSDNILLRWNLRHNNSKLIFFVCCAIFVSLDVEINPYHCNFSSLLYFLLYASNICDSKIEQSHVTQHLV